jgi:RHS repeat-associated protein
MEHNFMNHRKTCQFCLKYSVALLGVFYVCCGFSDALKDKSAPPPAGNRSIPNLQPPPESLVFSANPTAAEFFRAHIFQEPLVPVGGEPTASENAELAAALQAYAHRSGPDDFSSLTGFLEQHPQSSWNAALLTDLGLEYYNTAHYSLAIDAWAGAWALAKDAVDTRAHALAERALAELITMKARLGRMDEIEALLKSVQNCALGGPAGQRVTAAREALWTMKNRPEIAFRCGPLALRSIRLALKLDGSTDQQILDSASTQKGCSLPQVAELSRKIGLNYQMAHRDKGAEFLTPSVAHWKVGHYAALVKKEGDLYQLQDPTFGNETWATADALEAETSGYFLVPPGPLPKGWCAVNEIEGATVWGKGQTSGNDDRIITKRDRNTSGGVCRGMAVPAVHLMTVNLSLKDEPLGYAPPVGPPVRFILRYNHRDSFQPANFTYSNFGPKWTCDWISYVTDNPSNLLADVTIYMDGGGQRVFTGFDPTQQTFAPEQYDQTLLKRTGPASYELLFGDGSKSVYGQPDGSIGTTRKVFLTQMVDPQGNAVTLTYDGNLRIVALTDAIGQVTTLTYGLPNDIYKVTTVTDPFGRFATLDYVTVNVAWSYTNYDDCPVPHIDAVPTTNTFLQSITDVIGLSSRFGYLLQTNSLPYVCATCPTNSASSLCVSNPVSHDLIVSLTTPYGTTGFSVQDSGNTRALEITYPDASRERVEYNQTVNVPFSDPVTTLPVGVNLQNALLGYRNTFYWSRTACAMGYGDYSKARLFHWLHTENLALTSGAVESIKPPLEGRVWFDYPGQGSPIVIAPTTRPAHVGRVLDDGSTQLYTYGYNSFGKVTNSVDPAGRTLSLLYDTNDIDLLEVRQIRTGNDLLARITYNSQHRPLSATDAAGQTTTYTYNARGQVLTVTNPKNEVTTLIYDANGYLVAVDGPLPGSNDLTVMTYDGFGRLRTITDVSGYTLTFDYDNLDRLTRTTFPDSTFTQYSYDRLDCNEFVDRALRLTSFTHDNMRQLTSTTDPLGRTTLFDWCRCGALKSITDPMGRRTSWVRDVQGRRTAKLYNDGSQVTYIYESTTSRLRQVTDERQQSTVYTYNIDDTPRSISYVNASVATPSVSFTYDPDYRRISSITDGIGTKNYSYNPISSPPVLGAGELASTTGPLPSETATYEYDKLGRAVQKTMDGVVTISAFDAAGRIIGVSNALGAFTYAYDGSSRRLVSEIYPNGQTATIGYGNNLQDFVFQQITNAIAATPISQFSYSHDIPRGQITAWSQQAGSQSPSLFSFAYDDADQLLSATVTNSGVLVDAFGYSYDPAGNRLTELVGGTAATSTYNALNQLSTRTDAKVTSRTNEWDAQNRLTAVNQGNLRTEFAYDGVSRLASIRQLQSGSQVSFRRFVWTNNRISEERDMSGANITKRFYPHGVVLVTGTNAGSYYYTRDHLSSVRELTDGSGRVRARYSYDPSGRRIKVSGDLDADFAFAGMFWSPEVNLALTPFRAYDPDQGRWLSRDPLPNAETRQGPNLYAYVGNEPITRTDRLGLAGNAVVGFTTVAVELAAIEARDPGAFEQLEQDLGLVVNRGQQLAQSAGGQIQGAVNTCGAALQQGGDALNRVLESLERSPDLIDNSITRLSTLQGLGPDTIRKIGEIVEGSEPTITELFEKEGWITRWLNDFLPTVSRQQYDNWYFGGGYSKLRALADFIFDF